MTNTSATSLKVVTRQVRSIELRGVRVHNLKGIDLDLPLGQFVVISGVSGSGKSSLAFDTIFAEGQRRYVESFSALARQYLERIERPDADRIAHVPPSIAIRTDSLARQTSSQMSVALLAEIDTSLQRMFARVGRVVCPNCQTVVRPRTAIDVVHAVGQLPEGSRLQLGFAPPTEESARDGAGWLARGFTRAIVAGHSRSLDIVAKAGAKCSWIILDRILAGKASAERIAESAMTAFREGNGLCTMLVEASTGELDPTQPVGQFTTIDERKWKVYTFSRNWDCTTCGRSFLPPEIKLFEPGFRGGCATCRESERGDCASCHGSRLTAEALAVRVADTHIADWYGLTVSEGRAVANRIVSKLSDSERTSGSLLVEELQDRLTQVDDIGLGHLKLNRAAPTLSGGQVRRLLLAAAISSRMTGTLCLIDEPSAGLHPSEIPQVNRAIRRLLAQRNSVIVVDHSLEIILAADHVVELGPGAGPAGGEVVFQGRPDQLQQFEGSATGRALKMRLHPPASPRVPRLPADWLTLSEIRLRNLQGRTVKIPLGVLCVVTGPSGSGKSTLVADVVVPAIRQRLDPSKANSRSGVCSISGGEMLTAVSVIDRAPLTRSARSIAATWIDVFDEIRDVFAMTAEARQRGFGPQHFSFNAAQGGRCRACRGTGILRRDMQFLPDAKLTCPECGGSRFRREIVDIKYRGQSIVDVLAMSASQAATFFRNHPRLQGKLQMLKQIGLDYLVLGQPTETLSGGEAQRLKLAAQLTTSSGPTLIVCDEATVGLHPADVPALVSCFNELIDIGHSIVVVDNSPDLLCMADHVIRMDNE